jgi:excisionase family DNA binding protein
LADALAGVILDSVALALAGADHQAPTTPAVAPALLTATEAARYLGIGTTKLRELTNAGAIPSVKVDGSHRWRRTDLDAWVASLCVDGTRC